MKRVALYVRVSTQEQSTDLQRQELEQYLAARGFTQITVYEDKATGTNGNRPELKRLLADARSRKVDLVVCWKLDRLFRSLKDLLTTLQEFQDLGVEFISFKENIDMTTSAGRLLMQMIGAFAEFEASLIRERVRAGMAKAKRSGKHCGREREIDRDQVRALRAQGKSWKQIGDLLGVSKSGARNAMH